MLKGLALTPPILGRISIGKVVVNDKGTRLPQKDDEFTVTTLAKNKGEWIEHPLDEKLRKAQGPEKKKLHRIPIRLLFNDPDLNFRANYSMFDRETGRPTCVGDGNTCKRSTMDGVVSMPCPTPNQCEASKKSKNGCKPFGRFTARIDMGDEHQDELGSYILRTTGFNSIRTLESRQAYLDAFTGGKLLSCLPLDMVLRAKSTTQSHGAAIYFVDLTIRNGMTMAQAVEMAKKIRAEREAIGIDQAALDAAAREGFAHGAFEESEEEGEDIVPEFYPAADADADADAGAGAGAGGDDAGHDDPPPPAAPSLPPYSDADIEKNKGGWIGAFTSGKKTPQAMIDAISTKYSLTEQQKSAIHKMAPATTNT